MQDLTSPSGNLDPIERASADELRALQLERLRWSLRHAYTNVSHYRAAFEAAGVHPDDCKDLADLAKFPLTSKANLRDNYPFGMFAVPREQVVRVHASSGTTGRATVVGYTRDDIEVWAAVMARSIRAAGGRARPYPPQRLRIRAVHRRAGGALRGREARVHGHPDLWRDDRTSGHHDPGTSGRTSSWSPRRTCSRSSTRWNARATIHRRHRCGSASSAQSRGPTRCASKNLEARLGIDATDIYGLSEVMGPGVAQECVETKDGLHIWEDHFYPEVIDPLTGEPRPDGEEGGFSSLADQAGHAGHPLPDP